MNYSIPPKKIKHEDYLVPFEKLFRDLTKAHSFTSHDLSYVKTKLKDTCYSSLRFYNKKNHKFDNLSEGEYLALQELIALENLIIQRTDKGNMVVLIDKDTYIYQIEAILQDESKFQKLNINEDKMIQKLIETETKIKRFLNPLKEKGVISDRVFLS